MLGECAEFGARCIHFCMGAAARGTLSRPAAGRRSYASGIKNLRICHESQLRHQSGFGDFLFLSHTKARRHERVWKFSVMVFPPLFRGFVPSCAILFETPGIRRRIVGHESAEVATGRSHNSMSSYTLPADQGCCIPHNEHPRNKLSVNGHDPARIAEGSMADPLRDHAPRTAPGRKVRSVLAALDRIERENSNRRFID